MKRSASEPPGRGGGEGWGESTYKKGRDARRLASGCKFQILVSLKSPIVLAFKVSLRVAREEIQLYYLKLLLFT